MHIAEYNVYVLIQDALETGIKLFLNINLKFLAVISKRVLSYVTAAIDCKTATVTMRKMECN